MANLLTTREVQELLHVDRTTIYRMVESGQLPAIRVGKQWRFDRAALERCLTGLPVLAAHAPENWPMLGSQDCGPATGSPLSELLPMRTAQMIQDAFAELLGVTMVIADMDGQPITAVSNPCGLYSAMLRDPDAVARCVNDWQRLAGVVPIEPRFSPNDLGLLCARGLIREGNELKGMVFAGGIAPESWPPCVETMAAIASVFAVTPEYLAGHIEEAHRLDRPQRDRVLAHVQRIADIMSQLIDERGEVSL